jgi:hypothetical protein
LLAGAAVEQAVSRVSSLASMQRHLQANQGADTMEALRKLDHQFARIDRARAYAPRP